MTWARLDDNITDRPDLLALDRSTRLVHLEAIVWSCRHETDGSIPAHVLRKVTDADDPTEAAGALVAAGLWSETDGGWEVVGFLEDQISSADLARQRELAAVRQRRQRQHKAGDHSLCDARYCRRADELSRVTDTVSHDTPTRPDPTRPVGEGKGRKGGQGGSADAPPPAHPQEETKPTNLADLGIVDETTASRPKPRKIEGVVF